MALVFENVSIQEECFLQAFFSVEHLKTSQGPSLLNHWAIWFVLMRTLCVSLIYSSSIPKFHVNFKSMEQLWEKPNNKSNIAGLYKWFFCLVDELKISMYFIGEIAKHAFLGNVNLCTLLCSGCSQNTLNSSWTTSWGI